MMLSLTDGFVTGLFWLQRVEQLAKSLGFKQVSTSSSLVPMVRAVPRGLTATVDAYLTPVIREYLSGFLSGAPGFLFCFILKTQKSNSGL
jgi:5-oxoprolinase (ATP-hydrolysing)